MQLHTRLLDEVRRGSTCAVVGRPGAGVSHLLGSLCARAAAGRMPAVLASWERPPAGWPEDVRCAGVAIPEIIGWDLDEFDRSRLVDAAGVGALIAVDYVQLVDHSDDDASVVAALSQRARSRDWRLFLGVMAPRQLRDLEGEVGGAHAARITAMTLGPVLETADRTVVLTGVDADRRRVTMSSGSRVRWSQAVD